MSRNEKVILSFIGDPGNEVHEAIERLAAARESARKAADAELAARAKAIRTERARAETRELADEEEEVMRKYEDRAREVGALVDRKNAAYGSAFDKGGDFLRLLYPDGIKPEQYADMLALVRVFDKLMRIATDRDALGESPWQDVAGYALLSLVRVEGDTPRETDHPTACALPIDGESARAMGQAEAAMRGSK